MDCLFRNSFGKTIAQDAKLSFLPAETLFNNLIGDPREPQNSLIARLDQPEFEGSIGKFIELLQWTPGDQTQWGWGIEGDSFINLDSLGNDVYPERVNDWYLGTYFSEKTGDLSHRLEYLHVSSHLGDELFLDIPHIIYSRESFRYTLSYYPLRDSSAFTADWAITPISPPTIPAAGSSAISDWKLIRSPASFCSVQWSGGMSPTFKGRGRGGRGGKPAGGAGDSLEG